MTASMTSKGSVGGGTGLPTVAERARSIARRGGTATVLPATGCGRIQPLMHHIDETGDTVLLVDSSSLLVRTCSSTARGELPAMLEITDQAPVKLREPVRGLLWVTGWLQVLSGAQAHPVAAAVAEHRPDPRLLDVGHGATLLRLRAASLILADAEGSDSLHPAAFAEAAPDPFCLFEAGWLRHLEQSHPEVLTQLMRHVPARVRRRGARVRPLGLDRYGLRLRLEGGEHDATDTDVRVGFSKPVTALQELSMEIRKLLGCPFLRSVAPGLARPVINEQRSAPEQ